MECGNAAGAAVDPLTVKRAWLIDSLGSRCPDPALARWLLLRVRVGSASHEE